ncbi:type IV secretion system protein [Brucella sp. 6810]|uniref:type IV secretion system protein n=1 Tax=Brucella sp. 6810 TaxID=2769351 RepID=UPI00165A319F|nr:type IV secretion system protein [Brucella sp. 6810]QNQ63923.1 type IV secretion system protein [Brucella sp. 6810]
MVNPVIFEFIGTSIHNQLNNYVTMVASNTMNMIATTAVIAGGLYYTAVGLLMAVGRIEGPFSQLVISCIKFMLIAAFALNISTYSEWVIDTVHSMEAGFADAFAGNHGTPTNTIYQTLDNSLGKGWNIAAMLFEKGDNRGLTQIVQGFSELLLSFLVAGSTLVLAGPTGAMIVATNAVIAILLGIGPLFILALGWAPTRGFFDRWFGAIVTSVLQVALLSAVLSISSAIFSRMVAAINLASATQSTLFSCLSLTAVTIVMPYMMYKVYEYGGILGSSISAATISLGSLAVNTATPGGGSMTSIFSGSSGGGGSGSAKAGGESSYSAGGNAMWSPAYRQHVLGQFNRD